MAAACDGDVQLVDCRVELPSPLIEQFPAVAGSRVVTVPTPTLVENRCNGCGACIEVCRFAAMRAGKRGPVIMPERCCGCGACVHECLKGALKENDRELGRIEIRKHGRMCLFTAELKLGEMLVMPLIRALLGAIDDDVMTIVLGSDSAPIALRTCEHVLVAEDDAGRAEHSVARLRDWEIRNVSVAGGDGQIAKEVTA